MPFRLNDDWSLITRTKLPAEALPPKKAGNSWADGLSNGYTTFFLWPEHGRGFYWGAGPVLYYPAMSSALGATKWGSGPSVAFLHEDAGPWMLRFRRQQHLDVWRRGGQQRHQPNAAQPDHRLSFCRWLGAELVTRDHRELDRKRQQMDSPCRRRREQDHRFGEQPIKFGLAAYYNAIRPTASQDPWQLQATLTFVFSEQLTSPVLRKEP